MTELTWPEKAQKAWDAHLAASETGSLAEQLGAARKAANTVPYLLSLIGNLTEALNETEAGPLRCTLCGEPVSAETAPMVVRAVIECPECIRRRGDGSEVDKLRALVAELQAEVPHLVRMGPGAEGHWEVMVKRGPRLVEAMADALEGFLDASGAANYVETTLAAPDGRPFKLIVVRPDGQSPHELRVQAERELAEARAELAALRGADA
ncbi:hypothetical protein ABZ671_18785 [Micromonospora sp. NPDC006766]|uniref:hypothetical protein n=1 Tax=Micromonospora sp. NPDC006766 TaxID=3154778 RepID=UPI0033C04967